MLPRTVKERILCLYIHKNRWVIWKKKRKDSSLNGVEEIETTFKYGKNKINEDKLRQRICYRFPKQDMVSQLENGFIFDLETYIEKEYASPFAAGLYDVNRLREMWNKGLFPDETVIEKKECYGF